MREDFSCSDSKNSVTISALCAGALSCRSLRCLSPVLGQGIRYIFFQNILTQRFLLQFSLLAQEFAFLVAPTLFEHFLLGS